MNAALISPAGTTVLGIPTILFSLLIPIAGVAAFTYILAKRSMPLLRSQPDPRFDRFVERVYGVLRLWLGQSRHPRYMQAGVLHIMLFAGFLILSIRSFSMVILGIDPNFVPPGFSGFLGSVYNFLKDYAATWVLIACVGAAIRRGLLKPERYKVPERFGKDHTWEALLVLGLISTLMITESLFDASLGAANAQQGYSTHFIAPFTLVWGFHHAFLDASPDTLQSIHITAYYIHDLAFFFFLCFLPMGKHFHVVTSLFNVFFMKLDRGSVKPVRWGVSDDQLDDLPSFGVKHFEDFTWKHMLDFYSCADCGRCSDNCPANTVGRPLSPRFISIKCRDFAFANYPLRGDRNYNQPPMIGSILSEDEIWSCTTCGACEQECPLTIEYIDKIVDLRRGMVDEGVVPQSLQKPLSALEKRGNPWGKMERKRADWAKDKEFAATYTVKVLDKKTQADTLYFVDSISSFDDRMQEISRATAKVLLAAEQDFGILGKAEKDSGHEAKRFGEEMLFQTLKEANTAAIAKAGVNRIVTADPHAYNALKKDYDDLPPVEHISQTILTQIEAGRLKLTPTEDNGKVYTYHDPCYLGRHNQLYDVPRQVLDAIPGLQRVEMLKSRDRSFCCGGGGLMLFYEPEEDTRMGVLRVEMAKEAGANVIVTACPFCLVNIEDAIKVAGLEGEMEAIDLAELVADHTLTVAPPVTEAVTD